MVSIVWSDINQTIGTERFKAQPLVWIDNHLDGLVLVRAYDTLADKLVIRRIKFASTFAIKLCSNMRTFVLVLPTLALPVAVWRQSSGTATGSERRRRCTAMAHQLAAQCTSLTPI